MAESQELINAKPKFPNVIVRIDSSDITGAVSRAMVKANVAQDQIQAFQADAKAARDMLDVIARARAWVTVKYWNEV